MGMGPHGHETTSQHRCVLCTSEGGGVKGMLTILVTHRHSRFESGVCTLRPCLCRCLCPAQALHLHAEKPGPTTVDLGTLSS